MSGLRVSRSPDGALRVEGVPDALARVIREMPGLLGADQPEAVRKRLFPDASDDEETAADWRRTQHPELFALLADARTIVESDLRSLTRGSPKRTWRLAIPAAHAAAWISALNAARLALGALHEVTAADMDPDREPTADERGLAILRIDLYAWLQVALIEATAPAE